LLDGEPSSDPAGPFSWRHVALARATRWVSNERFDFVEGLHDGFRRLSSPATHYRSILFLKGDYWVVRDEVESATSHAVELRWHLAAGVRVAELDGSRVLLEGDCRGRTSRLTVASIGPVDCAYRADRSMVSPGFGELAPAWALSLGTTTGAAERLMTLLLPEPSTQAVAKDARSELIRSVPTERGNLWKLNPRKGVTDLLMFDSCASREEDVEFEGDWAWVRGGRNSPVREFLLIGGRRLRCGDALSVEAERQCEHIYGVLDGDAWSIKADDSCPVLVRTGDERWAAFRVATAGATVLGNR